MSIWLIASVVAVAFLALVWVLRAAVKSKKPIRTLWRSGIYGWLALGLVHLSAAWTGIGLGIGWFTGSVAFALGVPGVITLMLMNVIL